MQHHLLIDADDTLWENNIYFEQAVHEFIAFLDHSSLQPDEVRAVLNEIEHEMGYGSVNFTRSLLATYRRLAERALTDEDLERVRAFGAAIARHPIEVMSGVEETLTYLAARHRLILLTKGDEEEQTLKVENSGLADHFSSILVVAEKDRETYTRLVSEMDLQPEHTWMIGNSPRSDINPALAAGLNAVFIPHPHTWQLEIQELEHNGSGKFLQLSRFVELREHF
ncbi:MAG TPA: HAD family hydrolase [Ktedonobacteraceae bacterium]|jgi:putative hydrolase of the HAD superfamily|nr:HAD family hydrolase [Ktedonobacteraceae bacterium]